MYFLFEKWALLELLKIIGFEKIFVTQFLINTRLQTCKVFIFVILFFLFLKGPYFYILMKEDEILVMVIDNS